MPPPTLDRRVRKSRAQLRDALVELILERGWDEVSVLDVCERADVGRSTFYLHFADKEDLLLSGFDALHEGLHTRRTAAVGTFAFVEPLFEHARENSPLMQAVVGRKSGQVVQRRFRDVANQLVEAELASLGIEARVRAQASRYLGGALVELLVCWLEAPRGQDAAAVGRLYGRLSSAVVTAARAEARNSSP
jgi:AcrR family transcriptional regulator